jgi:hypothetical protein
MARTAQVTPDGWIVIEMRVFRTLTEYTPPRPWGWWDQICCDIHEPLITVRLWLQGLTFVVVGTAFVAYAVATGEWILAACGLLIPYGLWLLFFWAYLARNAIRMVRVLPLATGLIDELAPHPIIPKILAVGRGVRASGEPVDVAAGWPLARAIEQVVSPVEAWFMDDPTCPHQSVFAFRSVGPRPRMGVVIEHVTALNPEAV